MRTCLRGFRPGATRTRLFKYRRWLEAIIFGNRKQRNCSVYVAKTKVLISCMGMVQLICNFVLACALLIYSDAELSSVFITHFFFFVQVL